MSRRSEKKKGPKEKATRSKAKPEATPPARTPMSLLKRRRVLIAALAGFVTMILMAVIGGRQPPRITVINRTGETLNDVKVEYPGGSVTAEPVPEGGRASLLLRPDPANPKPPGSGPITVTCRIGEGLPVRFFSVVHGREYGAHDVLNVIRQPDGQGLISPAPTGGKPDLKNLLRRIGINL